jgi:hypothetical protein
MNLLLSLFFGAGVAAWIYSKMGRRLGYGNSQNVWTLVGVVFVMGTIFFYLILTTFLKPS